MLLPALATMGILNSKPDYAARAADWRNGAVIYQVFVDRFAPSDHLDAKRGLYPDSGRLMKWSQLPKPGKKDPKTNHWSHELDFWGGDLGSIHGKLDYIQGIGADVLYMTPIFSALTNHKYDTVDYYKIDPEFGTRQDFDTLVKDVHHRGMKVMLDGVFNHVGSTNPIFMRALADGKDSRRSWFELGSQYPGGYRGWVGIPSLPALNLEDASVRDYLWNGQDSVVRHWLKAGIDGWRLDVAFELGPKHLAELRHAAHETKPGSAVVGEISGYPSDWFDAVDGTFNFTSRRIGLGAVEGQITGGAAGQMLQDMVDDAGIENLLKCWLLTDNHDTARLASLEPDFAKRKLLVALQMTLPGSPVVYYGTELGLEGQGDPQDRAPMPWEKATPTNKELAWYRTLLELRKASPALKYGDFAAVRTSKLIAFVRHTDKVAENVMVVFNPTSDPVTETFPCRIGRLMSWGELGDVLSPLKVRAVEGVVTVPMPPLSVSVFKPSMPLLGGKTQYHRIP